MATNYKEYVHNLWVAESSSMVMKGVDDYIKIGREKIKNHPQFANLYKDQKRDYSTSVGPKYIKIWDMERGQKRSIHAFIDKNTGDVFKPASWNSPAKHVRYNLLNDSSRHQCLSNADWAGGFLYLRG